MKTGKATLMNDLSDNLLVLRARVLAKVGRRLGYAADENWVRKAAVDLTDAEIMDRLKRQQMWRRMRNPRVLWRFLFSK